MSASLFRRVVAEAIGAFALVFAGCGAIMVNSQTNALTHVGVALVFGLVIMVMISATGHLSGAHFNPAVTTAFALTGHFAWRDVPAYIAGQLVGAIAAALGLRAIFGNVAQLGATLPSGSPAQSFWLELVMSAFLMFVIIAVATDSRAAGQLAAVAIGGTVALDALFGGPLSGASMNPARSLGPALVAGAWAHQWLYVVAPLLGAAIGAYSYQFIRHTASP
jgi:MIP family channel proteins